MIPWWALVFGIPVGAAFLFFMYHVIKGTSDEEAEENEEQ